MVPSNLYSTPPCTYATTPELLIEGTPTPATNGKTAGGLVGKKAFAAWLESHPEWHREAAIAAGRATDKYLADWDALTPPNGAFMNAVPYDAALAYCASRGGLADLDASPLTWGDAPFMEHRQKDGVAYWRRGTDGVTSSKVKRSDAAVFYGFRCVN